MTDPTPEQQIDRTLRALGQVTPSPGLEARLLANLGAYRSAAPVTARHLWRFAARPAAVALTVLLLIAALVQLSHRKPAATSSRKTDGPAAASRPSTQTATTPRFTSPALPGKRVLDRQPRSGEAASLSSFGASTSPKASPVAKVVSTPHIHLETSRVSTVPQEDQALADLHAPSQVAPRLPPTAQERLVLLMLRRGEKHDLAQLDRAQQALFMEQEQAARRNFFDPPSPISPQPDYNTPGTSK